MRGAFVVRLGPGTEPSKDRFEGQVEEVDSGKEVRFHSGQELLEFLGSRFNAVFRYSEGRPNGRTNQVFSRDEEP
jgi:hypothetical protein